MHRRTRHVEQKTQEQGTMKQGAMSHTRVLVRARACIAVRQQGARGTRGSHVRGGCIGIAWSVGPLLRQGLGGDARVALLPQALQACILLHPLLHLLG